MYMQCCMQASKVREGMGGFELLEFEYLVLVRYSSALETRHPFHPIMKRHADDSKNLILASIKPWDKSKNTKTCSNFSNLPKSNKTSNNNLHPKIMKPQDPTNISASYPSKSAHCQTLEKKRKETKLVKVLAGAPKVLGICFLMDEWNDYFASVVRAMCISSVEGCLRLGLARAGFSLALLARTLLTLTLLALALLTLTSLVQEFLASAPHWP